MVRAFFLFSPLALLFLVGCGGGLHPVRGKVTFEDGAPVTKGTVIFESEEGEKKITARGEIHADGSYRLGTQKPGDGAPAGKYQVLVAPQIDMSADRPELTMTIDQRFTNFKTSGLEFEVKSGQNEFPIKVARNRHARGH